MVSLCVPFSVGIAENGQREVGAFVESANANFRYGSGEKGGTQGAALGKSNVLDFCGQGQAPYVLPLFVIMFIVNYLDRVNIGFVRPQAQRFGENRVGSWGSIKKLTGSLGVIFVTCRVLLQGSRPEILHFEGNNGPDGIKRKSPSQDEPWHFIDPTRADDRELIDMILDHHHNLVDALRHGNPREGGIRGRLALARHH